MIASFKRTWIQLLLSLLSAVALIYIAGCAQIVSPTGGPRDKTPPKIVETDPPQQTTMWNGDRFSITFDEFIQLDNINQNLIVSPPLAQKPKVFLKGKKLVVKFKQDLLKDSTTYSFYFGKSIKDFHEGNFCPPFTYAFSTGKTIDSLQISGEVRDALTNKFLEDNFVLLYSNMNDSAPKKEIPLYLTKTDKDGKFRIKNIKIGTYKIYALKDANNNLLFDQPKEMFAFSDSLVTPTSKITTHSDTIKIKIPKTKKEIARKDTTVHTRDSVFMKTDTIYYPNNIVLYSFVEKSQKQLLGLYNRERKEKFGIGFSMPMIKDTVNIIPLVPNTSPQLFIKEFSPHKDSLLVWLTDTTLRSNDSLKLAIQYFKHDSTGKVIWATDTILPRFDKRKDKQKGKLVCLITPSLKNNSDIDLVKKLSFEVNNPIKASNPATIKLYIAKDSLSIKDANDRFYAIDDKKMEIIPDFAPPKVKPFTANDDAPHQKVVTFKSGKKKFLITFLKPFSNDSITLNIAGRADTTWVLTEKDVSTNALMCWITDKQLLANNPFSFTVSVNGSVIDTLTFTAKKIGFNGIGNKINLYVSKNQQNALRLNEYLVVSAINAITSFQPDLIHLYNAKDTSKTNIPFTVIRPKQSKRSLYIVAKVEKAKEYTLIIDRNAITDIYGNTNKETDFTIKSQGMTNNYNLTPFNNFTIKKDSLSPRQFIVDAKWPDKKKIMMQILPNTFTDIYNSKNDSVTVVYNVPSSEMFGTLTVAVQTKKTCPVVIELWDKECKTMFDSKKVDKNKQVFFSAIKPNSYTLKAVFDVDSNVVWTTGKFLEHRQPESVTVYTDDLTIKANWDNKITWDIDVQKPFPLPVTNTNNKTPQNTNTGNINQNGSTNNTSNGIK